MASLPTPGYVAGPTTGVVDDGCLPAIPVWYGNKIGGGKPAYNGWAVAVVVVVRGGTK